MRSLGRLLKHRQCQLFFWIPVTKFLREGELRPLSLLSTFKMFLAAVYNAFDSLGCLFILREGKSLLSLPVTMKVSSISEGSSRKQHIVDGTIG